MMSNIFQIRDQLRYNPRSQIEFLGSSANTSQYGLNSLRVFSSKAWNMVPTEIKNSGTLNIFKEKMRKWEPKNCNCKLFLPCMQKIGYVNAI